MSVYETNDFRQEGEVRLRVDQNQIAIFERIDFNSLNRENWLAFANDAYGLVPDALREGESLRITFVLYRAC